MSKRPQIFVRCTQEFKDRWDAAVDEMQKPYSANGSMCGCAALNYFVGLDLPSRVALIEELMRHYRSEDHQGERVEGVEAAKKAADASQSKAHRANGKKKKGA